MNEIVVYSFKMGDVEDFNIYLEPVIDKFLLSEKGRWVSDNSHTIKYRIHDTFDFYHMIEFIAEMSDEQAFLYKLRFGNDEEYLGN